MSYGIQPKKCSIISSENADKIWLQNGTKRKMKIYFHETKPSYLKQKTNGEQIKTLLKAKPFTISCHHHKIDFHECLKVPEPVEMHALASQVVEVKQGGLHLD